MGFGGAQSCPGGLSGAPYLKGTVGDLGEPREPLCCSVAVLLTDLERTSTHAPTSL
jgi:hypothetical protein